MDPLKKRYLEVVIPRPLSNSFTYSFDDQEFPTLKPGHVCKVKFGKVECWGFVLSIHPDSFEPDYKDKVKAIQSLYSEEPVLTEKDIQFYRWVSEYYQVPLGEVFFSAFPKALFEDTKSRKEISKIETISNPDLELTSEQTECLFKISSALDENKYSSFLLYGVTGGGKTEVYIQAAEHCLKSDRSVIIMVPEIALTPQLRARFEERFGDTVAVLHSSLGESKRRLYWKDILSGKRTVVVGARSAVFAPVRKLGLIVVDEEHEPSYKQEGHLRYHGRDIALVRARIHNAIAILGSATPSIESYYGAQNNKHKLLQITKRPKERPLPSVEIVDLRVSDKKFSANSISPQLAQAIQETLKAGEQVIIFMNRKGYSSFVLCQDCGYVPTCNHCSVSLTYYKSSKFLKCHYCGFQKHAPAECEKCFSPRFNLVGIGTEALQEELSKIAPAATIARMDSETASTTKKLEEILDNFRSGKTNILIGTQMLAKGHDFPNVTLIGIVLAESALHLPDFRSTERTFQLLSQVSGRAGRGAKPGKVILQTYIPEHYVIQCAIKHDYETFYSEELNHRKMFLYPPFSRMAQIEFRNKNENSVQKEAQSTAQAFLKLKGESNDPEIMGPAPATINKIADEYRWHLILKSENISHLNSFLKTARKLGIRFIDVDPVNIL